MRPAPAFQCYAGSIIVDKQYRLMTPIERAVWVSIYLECWPNHAVPADPVELARYLHFSEEDVKAGLTDRVLSFFKKIRGELICPELEEYREKLRVLNLKKSEGGKKGAELKRSKTIKEKGNGQGIPESKPEGSPKGSLIQSNLNQTNQTQSIKKEVNPVNNTFVKEYEKHEDDYVKASKGY